MINDCSSLRSPIKVTTSSFRCCADKTRRRSSRNKLTCKNDCAVAVKLIIQSEESCDPNLYNTSKYGKKK